MTVIQRERDGDVKERAFVPTPQGFNGLATRCGCRCLVSPDERWSCECACSARHSSAPNSANGSGDQQRPGGALQRANTLTTYTSANHSAPGQRRGRPTHYRANGRAGSPAGGEHCCRCAVLSPSQRARGRPQRFVFRANFTKPSTSKLLQHQHAQQHQLLLANSKPPLVRNTSVVVTVNALAGPSTTAESHM